VEEEFGEGTSLVRSGTATCASDGRSGIDSIELITVPEPNTFVRAGLSECNNESDLRAENDQQERSPHDCEREAIVSSPEPTLREMLWKNEGYATIDVAGFEG
jgi:hypothetical protein